MKNTLLPPGKFLLEEDNSFLNYFFHSHPLRQPKAINRFVVAVLLLLTLMLVSFFSFSQNIAINATGVAGNSSAGLDVDFTNKGLLIPRVALTGTGDVATIASAATSLLVYNTATAGVSPNNVIPGYYYWNATKWINLSGGTGGNGWGLLGNAGTVDGTNFIGTTDNIPFNIRVNNQKAGRIDNTLSNTLFGYLTGDANTTGNANTAIGDNALRFNTTGYNNTANGWAALTSNNIGSSNTANGHAALRLNTSGNSNTAIGQSALTANTTGVNNTANGVASLYSNTTGNQNTANGFYALYSNVAGINGVAIGHNSQLNANNQVGAWDNTNTSVGYQSLRGSTAASANTGTGNTVIGRDALLSNSTGNNNTASGWQALYYNTTGAGNTADGVTALISNTTGSYNTANGMQALASNVAGNNGVAIGLNSQYFANNTATPYDNTNTSVGYQSLRGSTTASANTGYQNTAIGRDALFSNASGYKNTAIGYQALYSNNTGLGFQNTAIGSTALFSNTSGYQNTAIGSNALNQNASGTENTAIGPDALTSNITGNGNTSIGVNSLYFSTGSYNTANGKYALFNTTGSNNTAFGNTAGNVITTGSNNIAIGNNAQVPSATGNYQVQIGAATTTTFAGVTLGWTLTSDRRLKSDIKPTNLGLDFITKLKPVSYIRKNNESKTREYGFIAQDLEETLNASGAADNGIISKDDKGMYGVRYNDLISPMVKAIQELNKKNDELKITIGSLQTENQTLKVQATILNTQYSLQQKEIEKIKQQLGINTEQATVNKKLISQK